MNIRSLFNNSREVNPGIDAFAPPPRADYPQRALAFKTLLQNMPYRMLLLKNLNADELRDYVDQEIQKIESATVIKLSNVKKV
jgi:hypothetical protein